MDERNRTLAKLRRGEVTFGIGLRQARTIDIADAMHTVGYDWLFIDMEHNTMSVDVATGIAVAAQHRGITPIVRVPGPEAFHAARVLDGGAWGVVVPHVESAEAAAMAVSACRYPPLGRRSVAYSLPHFGFRGLPLPEIVAALERETIVVGMIESPAGVDRAEEIAAVPGLDVLMVGTQDLAMELGIPGQVDAPQVAASVAAVGAACRRHGKVLGLGGAYGAETVRRYAALGARFIQTGNDLALLMSAASDRLGSLRAATRQPDAA